MASSCSAIPRTPDKPPIDFESAYLNRQIRLVVIKELSAFNTHDSVGVHLEYDTANRIVFPSDYNLRLFAQEDGKWTEIRELPTIRPTGPVILSPSIPSSYAQIVAFWPQLDDVTKTYFMRAYVFGDMEASGGTKRVAAFADFVLTP